MVVRGRWPFGCDNAISDNLGGREGGAWLTGPQAGHDNPPADAGVRPVGETTADQGKGSAARRAVCTRSIRIMHSGD